MDCIAIALLALIVQSEAPHESLEGKIAVAYVAMNRLDQCTPECTLQKVLTRPRQFKLDPRVEVTESSYLAALTAYNRLQPDPTYGADHFYNPSIRPWPPWYDEQYTTAIIGHHTFIRLGGF